LKKLLSMFVMACLLLAPEMNAQTSTYDPFDRKGGGAARGASSTGSNLMESGEFVDAPIADVLRVVSDLTGWTIIMSPGVSERPPKVNLWVKKMRPADVLQQVVDLSGLVMHREGAAYHVMTFDEYARQFGVERKVRQLKHVTSDEVASMLQPFIEKSEAAKIIPVGVGNKVLLLVPKPLLFDIERLIDAIDVPFEKDEIVVVHLQHLDANAVVPDLEKFLVASGGGGPLVPARDGAAQGESIFSDSGEEGRKAGESLLIQFMVEPNLNAVVLRGLPADVKRASSLLKELDVAADVKTISYELKFINEEDAFETIEQLVKSGNRKKGGEGGEGKGSTNGVEVAVNAQNNRIVVKGPSKVHARVVALLQELDVPADVEIISYELKFIDAEEAFETIDRLFESGGGRQEGQAEASGATDMKIAVNAQNNQIVVKGTASVHGQVVSLLRELDVATDVEIVSYELKHTDAQEAFNTIEQLMAPDEGGGQGEPGEATTIEPRMKMAISVQNNRFVVEGSAKVQARVAALMAAVDQPLPPGSGDIRVYRLENATADEVVGVLSNLIEEDNSAPTALTEDTAGLPGADAGFSPPATGGGSVPPAPPAPPAPAAPAGGSIDAVLGVTQIPPRVTAAPEINAVVVRATAAEHEALAAVIRSLDQPRDQVLLEFTLVSVSSSEEFNLGVEVGGAQFGSVGTLGFTTFGIGQSDSTTGQVSLSPAAPFGLNLSVFNGSDLSLVVNALKTIGDTRVSSAPKLLVSDNSPGQLSQIAEEPFTTSSQGDATTVTSFGGFVEAGTTMQVIPHISKEDWLRLDYEIELSSFGVRTAEQLAANIPPPRAVNTTSGTVRIPAGYAVALGGLVAQQDDKSVDKVPFFGDLPVLGELFKNRRSTSSYTTLYIFIRPVILRDLGFRDLQLLSEDDLRAAEVGDGFPSNPMKLLNPAQASVLEPDVTEAK